MQNQENTQELLNEILQQPSNIVIADRFTCTAEAAPCNGQCSSGLCRSIA